MAQRPTLPDLAFGPPHWPEPYELDIVEEAGNDDWELEEDGPDLADELEQWESDFEHALADDDWEPDDWESDDLEPGLADLADADFAPPDELADAAAEREAIRDRFRFLTFRNYFGAAALAITRTYGRHPYEAVAEAVQTAPGVTKIQRRPLTNIERRLAIKELHGAWAHEGSLGRSLAVAIEDAPEVVMLENQSLAQSAHFVLYRGAKAVALALHWPPTKSHEQYLETAYGQLVRRHLLPLPWTCTANRGRAPRSKSRSVPAFDGFPTHVTTCDHQSRPNADSMWPLIATALKTTRDTHPKFEAALDGWRKQHPPRRARTRTTTRKRPVPMAVQDGIYVALRPTTLFDLVYRVRNRQQYQDDSSFLSSAIALDDAVAFNRDLTLLTRASLHAFEAIIDIAAGPALLREARDSFRAKVAPAMTMRTFDGRRGAGRGTRAGFDPASHMQPVDALHYE